MGSVFEWQTDFDDEQNAGLYNFVGHGSRVGSGNGVCAGYAVFNVTVGIDWTESAKADGVDGGQQKG